MGRMRDFYPHFRCTPMHRESPHEYCSFSILSAQKRQTPTPHNPCETVKREKFGSSTAR